MKSAVSLLIALIALPLFAQDATSSSVPRSLGPSVEVSSDPRSVTEEPSDRGTEKPWVFWGGIDAFITPDETYAAPTIMADRSWLHLEARYNYEGKETASVWAGYNINHANRDKWVVTPMVSAVFGDTKGIAPGVEVIANWKKFDVYIEGEYLFASGDDAEDFAYFWTELAWSPLPWLRTGIAAQRTRTFDTGVDVQRGLLIGFKYKKATFTTSIFEPGSDNQTIVATVASEF